jgi:hypothetical protein
MARPTEPSVRWGAALNSWLAASCLVAAVAHAQPQPLRAGTFRCVTIATLQPRTRDKSDPAEINRRAGGSTIRPMTPSQLLLAPAAFGNVVLDGNANWRFTAIRQGGRYGFNRATGRPTFTGDLGAMEQGEYSGTGTSFIVGFQGVSYKCALPADGAEAGSAASRPPVATITDSDRELVASVGAVRSNATAANFTGRLIGFYRCGQAATMLRLELTARSDGTLEGVLRFGGANTPGIDDAIGTYAVSGTWSASHFVLRPTRWMKQPAGYAMVGLEGDATTGGLAGKLLDPACTVFAVEPVVSR